MTDFSILFQPGYIGKLRLENRLIMPAMGSALAAFEGRFTDKFIEFYRTRARGGVGLVFPCNASVSADAPFMFAVPINEDSWVNEWKTLVDSLHAVGAKVGVQLMHAGMVYLTAEEYIPDGISIMVPSMTPWLKQDKSYHVLDEDDIDRYVEDFSEAARRVREAGADLVELHACHGCLVNTFLSPLTNKRTDKYGGSVENRARFPRRIVEGMRNKVGPDFPISVRINGSDGIEGGITIEEATQHASILESAGADAISVTSGLEYWSTNNIPCYPYPEGSMLPLVREIKKAVNVPVIAVGKIKPELAAQVISDNQADFVAMARPILADPDFPNKLREGQIEDVRRCVYCMNCLKSITCTVNPFMNRETEYPLEPAKSAKDVMVVGGGLSGMQTALFLAERGHRVSLYEKNGQLGGQWNTACATPGKEGYGSFTEYLKRGLDKYGVSVTLSTEVNKKMVLKANTDAVVVATGAVPVGLPIPGALGPNVVQGHDVLDGKAEANGRVAVVGGRFIGMEAAIMLAEQGKDVCIVTRAGLGEDGISLESLTFKTLALKLLDLRVPLYLNSTVQEITDKAIFIRFQNDMYWLQIDTVVLSVGMKADNKLAQELEGAVPELYTVGDCVNPQDAAEATYQASVVAAKI
ncbi:FAD-dependent oxidoreductase [Chloroflexota bacterium]